MLVARNSDVPPGALRKVPRALLGGTNGYGISLYGNAPVTTMDSLVKMTNGVLSTFTAIQSLTVEPDFSLQNLATDLNISMVARNILNPITTTITSQSTSRTTTINDTTIMEKTGDGTITNIKASTETISRSNAMSKKDTLKFNK